MVAVVTSRAAWRRQPFSAPTLNRGHPLYPYLTLAWVPGLAEANLVDGSPTPYTNASAGTKSVAVGSLGRHVSMLTSGGNFEWFTVTSTRPAAPVGGSAFMLIPTPASQGTHLTDGNTQFAATVDTNAAWKELRIISGGVSRGIGATDITNLRDFSCGFNARSGRYQVFLNGRNDTATDTGAAAGFIAFPTAICETGGWGYTKSVTLIYFFNRELTDAEHAALHENPWQLFQPTRSRVYSIPAAAVASTTPKVVPLRRGHTRQPRGLVEVNWNSPLTRGLIMAAVPVRGHSHMIRDAITGKMSFTDSLVDWKKETPALYRGHPVVGTYHADSSHTFILTGSTTLATTDDYSHVALLGPGWNGQNGGSSAYASAAGWYASTIGYTASGQVFSQTTYGGASTVTTSGTITSDPAVPHLLGHRHQNGIGDTVFLDGRKDTFNSTGTTGALYQNPRDLTLGLSTGWNGPSLVWSRALSDDEFAALGENPWQVFVERRARLISIPGTTAAGFKAAWARGSTITIQPRI